MPARKKPTKKKEEEEESEEEILEEQTEFNINIDDDVKPFTNEYDELVKFDSLEKLPSEVVFEIFSFLPTIPYYFKLQLLSKFYKEKFEEIITKTAHLDLASLNLQHHAIWPKVCKMIKDCGDSLKSIQLGELNYKWNEIKESILKKCSKLEELALVTPTIYFSSLFRKDNNYYGYYGAPPVSYDEDKKNRDVWSNTLTTLNVIGLERPRKGRRNHSYLFTSATMKYILEKFPKIKNINFILTNYTEAYVQSLYDAVMRNRKRLLDYREKGGSTDGLYERTGIWYEEAMGVVDFEIPNDLKINIQGSIGKLSSIDAAKNIVEVYNINPNTKFEFLFSKNSNGTLLDQIIGSRAAYKQKHQVINYLLNNGSLISNLSAHSWINILKQPNEKIKKLLEEISKWVTTKNEGKMLSSTMFSAVVNGCISQTSNLIKNLQVMLDNGWKDTKDSSQDFITPSIVSNDLCTFMIEKAGCKLNPSTAAILLSSALYNHFNSLPIVLKLVPEKLAEVSANNPARSTLSQVIATTEVPDSVINYIFNFIVKPDYALNVFTDKVSGETIIHQLIVSGRFESLRLLLDMLKEQKRVEKIINVQDISGNTVVHLACRNNKIQLAKDLVNHYGANKNLPNNNNLFPYDLLKGGFLSFFPEVLKPDQEKVDELNESLKKKEKEELAKSKKKKSPKKAAPKRKKEESEEEEEEEEEKPRRSTRKKTKKEVQVDLTQDDEEEPEEIIVEEEESEEEKKAKKKTKNFKKEVKEHFKKMREPSVSYLLPYPNNKIKAHRFGINKLIYCGENQTDNDHQEYLLSGGRDGTIKCWSLNNTLGKQTSIQSSPLSSSSVSSSSDQHHKYVFSLEEHIDWVTDMILLPDRHHLISCSQDNTLMLWDIDINDPKHCLTYRTHTDYVTCLAAPTNHLGQMTCSTFCSGGLDCSVFVWDAERLCSIRSYFESVSNNLVNNQQVNNQEFSQKPFQQYDIQSLQNYYPPQLNSQPKHSVYALDMSTCGNQGTLIEQHMLVAAGSTDQLVRLYDLRTASKVGKLRGHKDNIRCLKLTSDGKNCITGSTDGTVKYWDLRNQRCLQTFSFNSSKTSTNASIWTLEFDPFDSDQASFTIGTRDGFVYYLDAKNKKMCTVADLNSMSSQSFNKHSVLCTSIAPKGGKLSSTIWIGSTDSNIYEFEYGKLVDGLSASKDPYSENTAVLTPKSASNSFNNMDMSPVFSNLVDYSPLTPKTPSRARASSFQVQRKASGTLHCHPKSKILGSPGIIAHFILNCRKRVLVKDNSGRVTLWDITTGNMLKDYTELNNTMTDDGEDLFENLCNDFSKEMISVRNWFTVEKKLGCLEIVLNPNECFNAENYAIESGFQDAFEEEKVNYGIMTIKALFRNWYECRNEVLLQQMSEEERKEREERINEERQQQQDNPSLLPERRFSLPDNTSVIVHFEKNDSEKSPFKKQLRHFDGNETEGTHIPKWVVEILRGLLPNVNAQSHKLSFYLEPAHDEKCLGPLLQNHAKLVAHRILRIYKVAAHIATKLNFELPTVKELEESKKLYYELKAKEHEENPQIPLVTQQDDENFDESLTMNTERDPNEQCRPEEYIEIICYGNRMKNNWNLAIANAFYRPNNVSWITLNYRQRYRTK